MAGESALRRLRPATLAAPPTCEAGTACFRPRARNDGRRLAAGWRRSPATVVALMLLSTAPFWFVRTPPLIDLLGHMGRYHVELNLAHSPLLQRSWAFHWRLVANLGVDLLIVPLAAILGLPRAVWLVAMALPPLMIWGLARLSRAVHGELTPFALAAAPFALAYPYQYGFVNYWLSCALALHAFASWIEADAAGRRAIRRIALFTPAAVLIWLAHAYGWAVFVILVGSYELGRAWRPAASAWPRMALTVLEQAWPVAVPLVLMLVWRQGAQGASTWDFFDLREKVDGLLCTLRDQNIWLDSGSLLFALALVYAGARNRMFRKDVGLTIAAGLFLAAILLLPAQLFGSAFADQRLWPIFFLVSLAAIAPKDPSWGSGRVIAGLALAVFVARMAFMTAGFAAYQRDYSSHLEALEYAPQGASIAVLTGGDACDGWRHERVTHLGALAIVRNQAFVNSEWDIPGAQLLTPLHARGTGFNADPSEYVGCDPQAVGFARRLSDLPRDRFDFVWLLGFDTRRLKVGPGMDLVYSDDRSAFYRLTR